MPTITNAMLYSFFTAFIPAMVGIICHEVAHGWVAYKQGDPTAKSLGRLTLNPVKHLDPMGTLVFVLTALFSNFIFGWAKPVPIQPGYFKKPREGMMLVSFAGPLTNFLLAIMFAVIVRVILEITPYGIELSPVTRFVLDSAQYGITINCMLGIFNLLPLPPLDGSHILGGLLPPALARQYYSMGKYGFIVLIVLLYTGVLGSFLWPLLKGVVTFVLAIVGLS